MFSSISSWYSALYKQYIGGYICLQIRHLNVTTLTLFFLDVSSIYFYSQCLKFGFIFNWLAFATLHCQGVVIVTCETWLPNYWYSFRCTFSLSDVLVLSHYSAGSMFGFVFWIYLTCDQLLEIPPFWTCHGQMTLYNGSFIPQIKSSLDCIFDLI